MRPLVWIQLTRPDGDPTWIRLDRLIHFQDRMARTFEGKHYVQETAAEIATRIRIVQEGRIVGGPE